MKRIVGPSRTVDVTIFGNVCWISLTPSFAPALFKVFDFSSFEMPLPFGSMDAFENLWVF